MPCHPPPPPHQPPPPTHTHTNARTNTRTRHARTTYTPWLIPTHRLHANVQSTSMAVSRRDGRVSQGLLVVIDSGWLNVCMAFRNERMLEACYFCEGYSERPTATPVNKSRLTESNWVESGLKGCVVRQILVESVGKSSVTDWVKRFLLSVCQSLPQPFWQSFPACPCPALKHNYMTKWQNTQNCETQQTYRCYSSWSLSF